MDDDNVVIVVVSEGMDSPLVDTGIGVVIRVPTTLMRGSCDVT